MAHAQASPPTTQPQPLLLRHFPVVYAWLFEFLAPRDLVVLLSSCQALRSDVGIAAHALQTNKVTSHFGQCCPRDWCATTPPYDRDFECDGWPRDLIALLSSCRALRSDVSVAVHVPQTNKVTSHFGQCYARDCCPTTPPYDYKFVCYRWPHEQQLCDAEESWPSLVALLSLTGLMATQLKEVLYSEIEGYVDRWQVVPFIIPAQVEGEVTPSELCRVLESFKPGLGTAFASSEPFLSQPGLHWENLEAQGDTGDVSCVFCEMVGREGVQFRTTGHAYWEHRYAALAQVRDECRNAGYYSGSDEFEAREEAFLEQVRVTDTFYDESLLDEDFPTLVQSLLRRGRLPLLRLMEPMTNAVDDDAMHAAAEGYTEQLCPQVYRPLRKFFSTNGFQYVRRLQASPYSDDEMRDDDLISGEMVGGLTPHGFFAGVSLVEYMV